MTSPANIPQEIIDEIIQHAQNDPTTLCNLCLVASSFLPRTRQILYRNINTCCNDYDVLVFSEWAVTGERVVKFFETLTTHNNALAEHVQRLYDNTGFCESYEDLVKWSLRLMVNLQSLILINISSPATGFFDGCTFRLKIFGCDISYDDDIQIRREITRFLASQPEIQLLDACGYTAHDESLPKPHLPKLQALVGDTCTIENLLPQQPLVINLTWELGIDDRSLGFPTPHLIASSLSNIHHFSLVGYFWRYDIGLFIPYLPSVQVLRLVGESPVIPLAKEFALIADLPKLQILIWSGGPPLTYKNKPVDKLSQYEYVKGLFEKARFLEKVYIQTPSEMTGNVLPRPKFDSFYYLCWERQKPEPTVVGFQDAVVAHKFISWSH